MFFDDLFFESMTDRVASLALRTLGDSLRATDLSSLSKNLNADARSLVTFIVDKHGMTRTLPKNVFTSPLEVDAFVDQLHEWLPGQEELQSLPPIPATLDDRGLVTWLFEPDLATSPWQLCRFSWYVVSMMVLINLQMLGKTRISKHGGYAILR